jgi:light-harvesting complex I chlorophyll a/b binding protein 3
MQSLVLASRDSLAYLDGSLPGDMGFDPLGLFAPDNQVGDRVTGKASLLPS